MGMVKMGTGMGMLLEVVREAEVEWGRWMRLDWEVRRVGG